MNMDGFTIPKACNKMFSWISQIWISFLSCFFWQYVSTYMLSKEAAKKQFLSTIDRTSFSYLIFGEILMLLAGGKKLQRGREWRLRFMKERNEERENKRGLFMDSYWAILMGRQNQVEAQNHCKNYPLVTSALGPPHHCPPSLTVLPFQHLFGAWGKTNIGLQICCKIFIWIN